MRLFWLADRRRGGGCHHRFVQRRAGGCDDPGRAGGDQSGGGENAAILFVRRCAGSQCCKLCVAHFQPREPCPLPARTPLNSLLALPWNKAIARLKKALLARALRTADGRHRSRFDSFTRPRSRKPFVAAKSCSVSDGIFPRKGWECPRRCCRWWHWLLPPGSRSWEPDPPNASKSLRAWTARNFNQRLDGVLPGEVAVACSLRQHGVRYLSRCSQLFRR